MNNTQPRVTTYHVKKHYVQNLAIAGPLNQIKISTKNNNLIDLGVHHYIDPLASLFYEFTYMRLKIKT